MVDEIMTSVWFQVWIIGTLVSTSVLVVELACDEQKFAGVNVLVFAAVVSLWAFTLMWILYILFRVFTNPKRRKSDKYGRPRG